MGRRSDGGRRTRLITVPRRSGMARRSSSDSVELEGRSIRVLLAEDMDLLRTALVSLLSEEEDMEVIADLKCNERAVSVAVRLRPDVAVGSADLPETNGLTTVHE